MVSGGWANIVGETSARVVASPRQRRKLISIGISRQSVEPIERSNDRRGFRSTIAPLDAQLAAAPSLPCARRSVR
jgi:hypothetical protein